MIAKAIKDLAPQYDYYTMPNPDGIPCVFKGEYYSVSKIVGNQIWLNGKQSPYDLSGFDIQQSKGKKNE